MTRKQLAMSLITKAFEEILKPCLDSPEDVRIWHKETALKGAAEAVTSLDTAIGEFLVQGIRANHVEDEILCEETGHHVCSVACDENWTWVIDPIDGTDVLVDYLSGRRQDGGFVIQMAVGRNWRPEVGVIFDPTTLQMNIGEAGLGFEIWERGTCRSRLKGAVVTPFPRKELNIVCWPECLTTLGGDRVIKSTVCMGLSLLQVAVGEIDVFVFPLGSSKIWDTAPAMPLLWERDCVLVDRSGIEYKTMKEPVNSRGLIACRREILTGFLDRYGARINWQCDI